MKIPPCWIVPIGSFLFYLFDALEIGFGVIEGGHYFTEDAVEVAATS